MKSAPPPLLLPLLLLFLLLLLLLTAATAARGGCPHRARRRMGDGDAGGALEALNALLQTRYAAAKAQRLLQEQQRAAVFISSGDTLRLLLPNGSFSAPRGVVPPLYTALKLCSHSALAVAVLCDVRGAAGGALDGAARAALQQYVALLPEALLQLHALPFSAEQLARNKLLLGAAQQLLQRVAAAGSVRWSDVQAFGAAVRPLVAANVNESAVAQLQFVHSAVMDLVAAAGPALPPDWRSTARAIVAVGHMPRRLNLLVQYFARLLGAGMEDGRRVVSAEAITSDDDLLDLLATHIVDFDTGDAMFSDAEHMHYDILAWSALQYLPKLLP